MHGSLLCRCKSFVFVISMGFYRLKRVIMLINPARAITCQATETTNALVVIFSIKLNFLICHLFSLGMEFKP